MRVALELSRLCPCVACHAYLFSVWMYWTFALNLYFSVSGEDQTLYDLSGFDIVYEHGDDASESDYPTED